MKKYLAILPIVASCSGVRHSSNIHDQESSSQQQERNGEESNNKSLYSLVNRAEYKIAKCIIFGPNSKGKHLTLRDMIEKYDTLIEKLAKDSFLPYRIKQMFLTNVIRYIIEVKGEKIDEKYLLLALENRCTELLQPLLDYIVKLKENLECKNGYGSVIDRYKLIDKVINTATSSNLNLEESKKMIYKLISLGADVNAEYNSALFTAILHKEPIISIYFTKVLLEAGADPNKSAIIGNMFPLIVALMENKRDIGNILIEYGAKTYMGLSS